MPRYFFDFYGADKESILRDSVGSECSGRAEVREEAMHALPALAKDKVPQDGDTQAFTVSVRNEMNVTVYTATLTYAGIWFGEDIPPVEELSD
ncbi:DUF6894 family protein [Methylobacterium sp. E-045]|uniref:DUF6894 family protein n=1 Tax=Methylobacterium sp. E-045 TaxID=2836575 RepID=UPI001FB9E59C|nr:hypothetical protein [Methylobacterium sp. E-045]MCJ2128033.1 hypothetical protein [Methylobacterium sp. E-045]